MKRASHAKNREKLKNWLKYKMKTRKPKPQKLTPDKIKEKFRLLMMDVEQLEHREMCVLLVQLRIQLTDAIKLELEKWEFSEIHEKIAKDLKHSDNKN